MNYLIIITICCFTYKALSLPTKVKPEVEISKIREHSFEVHFTAVRNALYYIVHVLPSEPNEYEDETQTYRIEASNTSHVTANVTFNLKEGTSYDVTIFAITMVQNVLYREVGAVGKFKSPACESGLSCYRNISEFPLCFQPEWRCNGVVECLDEMDETDCDTQPIEIESRGRIVIKPPKKKYFRCDEELLNATLWYQTNPTAQKSQGPRKPFCEANGSYAPLQCWEREQTSFICVCVDTITGQNITAPVDIDPFVGFVDNCTNGQEPSTQDYEDIHYGAF